MLRIRESFRSNGRVDGDISEEKFNFGEYVKPLHYLFKIFGVSCVEYINVTQFAAEAVYIFVLLASYSVFVYKYVNWSHQTHSSTFELSSMIVGFGFYIGLLAPAITSARMKMKNNELIALIDEVNKICANEESLRKLKFDVICGRTFFVVISYSGVWVYVVVSYISGYCEGGDFLWWHLYHLVLDFSLTYPVVQFVCWTMLFRLMLGKTLERLSTDFVVMSPSTYDADELHLNLKDAEFANCIRTVKRLLKFKIKFIKIYGLQVILFMFVSTLYATHALKTVAFPPYEAHSKDLMSVFAFSIFSLLIVFGCTDSTSSYVRYGIDFYCLYVTWKRITALRQFGELMREDNISSS